MGEPAEPTPADRHKALELARALVEAVRNDEAWPEPLTVIPHDHALPPGVDAAVFSMAQLLVLVVDGCKQHFVQQREIVLEGETIAHGFIDWLEETIRPPR